MIPEGNDEDRIRFLGRLAEACAKAGWQVKV